MTIMPLMISRFERRFLDFLLSFSNLLLNTDDAISTLCHRLY